MHLNQRRIEVFNAVMIHKSVTAAAVSLKTSQPTISRELRELENLLGFELFQRFGKRLTPTKQALSLHLVVQRSFVGMEAITRAAIAIGGYNATHLRIACIPAYAEAVLPVVASRFLQNNPQVHLSVHSLEEEQLQQDLAKQMFDIGLTESSYDHSGVTSEKLSVGEVMCVLPAGHRLADKAVLEPQDFEGIEFVYFSRDDPYRSKLDGIFDAAGVTRNYTMEATTATGVCSMVAAGVGVSIVNPLTAAHYAGRGVELRKLSVCVPYQYNLWRSENGAQSALADQFVQLLRQFTKELTTRLGDPA